MTEKMDSKWLSLATVSILGQTPSESKLRFGIFPKLLITLVAISVIPLSIVWYINYHVLTATITMQVNERLDRISDGLLKHVNDWMEMNYRMLKENASLPAIKSMDTNTQKTILKLITEDYPWIHSAITIAPDGTNISRNDDRELKNYSERIYVKRILDGEPEGHQVLIGKTSGLPALTLATAISDKNGNLKGILAATMASVAISDRITNERIGDTGYAFLLDEHGKVIAHQSQEDTKFRQDFSEHPVFAKPMQAGGSKTTFFDVQNNRVIAAVQRTEHGWVLVTQQNYSEAFAAVNEANRNALVLLLITLVVVVIVSYLLSRRLSDPIRGLTDFANETSMANFKVLEGSIQGDSRNDEIGELARAIQRLAVSLRIAIKRLQRNS